MWNMDRCWYYIPWHTPCPFSWRLMEVTCKFYLELKNYIKSNWPKKFFRWLICVLIFYQKKMLSQTINHAAALAVVSCGHSILSFPPCTVSSCTPSPAVQNKAETCSAPQIKDELKATTYWRSRELTGGRPRVVTGSVISGLIMEGHRRERVLFSLSCMISHAN